MPRESDPAAPTTGEIVVVRCSCITRLVSFRFEQLADRCDTGIIQYICADVLVLKASNRLTALLSLAVGEAWLLGCRETGPDLSFFSNTACDGSCTWEGAVEALLKHRHSNKTVLTRRSFDLGLLIEGEENDAREEVACQVPAGL